MTLSNGLGPSPGRPLPPSLAAVDAFVIRAARSLALLGLLGLACQAFMVLADVSLRWLFDAPLRGLEDLSLMLIAIALAAFFPVAMAQRENVAISGLGGLLGARAKAALDTFGAAGMAVMTLLIAWQVSRYALELLASGRESMVLALPVAPAWFLVTLLLWLTALVQCTVLVVTACKLGCHFAGGER